MRRESPTTAASSSTAQRTGCRTSKRPAESGCRGSGKRAPRGPRADTDSAHFGRPRVTDFRLGSTAGGGPAYLPSHTVDDGRPLPSSLGRYPLVVPALVDTTIRLLSQEPLAGR